MIDPFTAIGLATSAFKGIKSAIDAGKDLQDMTSQLGQWGKAISDLDYTSQKAEKPPWWKKMGGGVEANALEVFMHKKKADDMREELREYISLYYGPSAWKEIVHTEKEMRKHQKATVQAAIEKREAIINAIIIGTITVVSLGLAFTGLWWLADSQGKL